MFSYIKLSSVRKLEGIIIGGPCLLHSVPVRKCEIAKCYALLSMIIGRAELVDLSPYVVVSMRMRYMCAFLLSHCTLSVDGDGTVHISREMHKQCFITRPEMTSRAPKPHRHRSRT